MTVTEAVPTTWDEYRAELESDYRLWLPAVLPGVISAPLASHQHDFWRWVWSIQLRQRVPPFLAVWNRGGAKSSSGESGLVSLGARRKRRYALAVSRTQDQANDHVGGNISNILESPEIAAYYPDMADRMVGKFGASKGWGQTRLRTKSGFTVDAVGLDTAMRGIKLDQQRPDLIYLDDIDEDTDTPATVRKLEQLLTRKLLQAGSVDVVVLGVQNLVSPEGVFGRLVANKAGYLVNRIVSGPVPAVRDMQIVRIEGRDTIVGGEATWAGFPLEACQARIDEVGLSAFLSEAQHDTEPPAGGMFSHLDFEAIHVTENELPQLIRSACWCDVAVTNTDQSDSHAVMVGALGTDGRMYHLFSWEQRATPVTAISVAIDHAVTHGCQYVGVETDQGGDTWESVFREAKSLVSARLLAEGRPEMAARVEALTMRSAKAGSVQTTKAGRAQRFLLPHYERDRIRHVTGTHTVIERALRRFPLVKPFDGVDAAAWLARDLLDVGEARSNADQLLGRNA